MAAVMRPIVECHLENFLDAHNLRAHLSAPRGIRRSLSDDPVTYCDVTGMKALLYQAPY